MKMRVLRGIMANLRNASPSLDEREIFASGPDGVHHKITAVEEDDYCGGDGKPRMVLRMEEDK